MSTPSIRVGLSAALATLFVANSDAATLSISGDAFGLPVHKVIFEACKSEGKVILEGGILAVDPECVRQKVKQTPYGCCYDVATGLQSGEAYSNLRDMYQVTCPVGSRPGGATRFSNVACTAFKVTHSDQILVSGDSSENMNFSVLPDNENTSTTKSNPGCCYDIGFNAYLPSVENFRDVSQPNCATEERLGGATRWSNMSCEQVQLLFIQNVFPSVPNGGSNLFDSYNSKDVDTDNVVGSFAVSTPIPSPTPTSTSNTKGASSIITPPLVNPTLSGDKENVLGCCYEVFQTVDRVGEQSSKKYSNLRDVFKNNCATSDTDGSVVPGGIKFTKFTDLSCFQLAITAEDSVKLDASAPTVAPALTSTDEETNTNVNSSAGVKTDTNSAMTAFSALAPDMEIYSACRKEGKVVLQGSQFIVDPLCIAEKTRVKIAQQANQKTQGLGARGCCYQLRVSGTNAKSIPYNLQNLYEADCTARFAPMTCSLFFSEAQKNPSILDSSSSSSSSSSTSEPANCPKLRCIAANCPLEMQTRPELNLDGLPGCLGCPVCKSPTPTFPVYPKPRPVYPTYPRYPTYPTYPIPPYNPTVPPRYCDMSIECPYGLQCNFEVFRCEPGN